MFCRRGQYLSRAKRNDGGAVAESFALSRRLLIGSALGLIGNPAMGQTPASAEDLFFGENRYLPYLLKLRERDGPGLDQFSAFVGDADRALRDVVGRSSLGAEGVSVRDAIPVIVAASRGRQVVILNEAHVSSLHRHFLLRLLRALKPEGFTHLAAETFFNGAEEGYPDIAQYGSGKPFSPDYGYYTRDPVFAEAVREAASVGYNFISYEAREDQSGSSGDPRSAIAAREKAQAENFFENALRRHPHGRFVVYVGYSHLLESPDAQNNVWFAARLRELTGIDPLTIEQSSTGSFGPHGQDSPLNSALIAAFAPRDSFIAFRGGAPVVSEKLPADLAVHHLPTRYIDGRPSWLIEDKSRRPIAVDLTSLKIQPPFLVQAIHDVDEEFAVPADQVLVETVRSSVALALRQGRYRLRLETVAGLEAICAIDV